MRTFALIAVVAALACSTWAADADMPAARVSLCRAGVQAEVPAGSRAGLAAWALDLLRTSNFNSAAHSAILKQSVPDVQRSYREVAGRACLVVTLQSPTTLPTVGGDVTVAEIVIGLPQPGGYATDLFTVDESGRVVVHAKWAGSISTPPADFPVEGR